MRRSKHTIGLNLLLAVTLLSLAGWAPGANAAQAPNLAAPLVIQDHFGYQMTVVAVDAGINTSGGVEVQIGGPSEPAFSSAINIGFPFRFYEGIYNELYVSIRGVVTFGSGTASRQNTSLPREAIPNNMLAPFWNNLSLGENGHVYTKLFDNPGEANDYFVVEWQNVGLDPQAYTFQVVLYRSGNIRYQYLNISGNLQDTATVGIEDMDGVDGLQYDAVVATNTALLITRPANSRRVKVLPAYQAGFTATGKVDFLFEVRNTGDLGADTYNLAWNSSNAGWNVDLLDQSSLPLGDSNSDTIPDTGAILQGESRLIKVRVTALAKQPGDYTLVDLEAESIQTASAQAPFLIQAAVPVQFAQVYADNSGVHLSQLWYINNIDRSIWPENTGRTLSVGGVSTENYLVAWEQTGITAQGGFYSNMQYKMVNRISGVGDLKYLTNYETLANNANLAISATDMALAAAPNGKIGAVWQQFYTDKTPEPDQIKANIFLRILNADGTPATNAISLTNGAFYTSESLNRDSYTSPFIAATGDNRFFIAWLNEKKINGQDRTGLHYAVYNTSGQVVAAPANPYQQSSLDASLFLSPFLAGISSNRVLLAYTERDKNTNSDSLLYAVLNSGGGEVQAPVNTGFNGRNAVAAEFLNVDRDILLAWYDDSAGKLSYAVVDGATYAVQGGYPQDVPAVNYRIPQYPSLIVEAQSGYGVLTWSDIQNDYLYYTLIDANGALKTLPMTFFDPPAGGIVQSSQTSLGVAAYAAGVYQAFMPMIRK